MRNIIRFALLGLVLLALASCQSSAEGEATADLAGTSWVLSSLDGNVLLPGTTITLQFGADDVAVGSDGCNRFRTTFSQDGAKLTFGQPGASTMMACPEPIMDQATAFMAALAKTTGFSTTEDKLVLRAGNKDVATLTAISQGLADTAWDVVAYNNGREAVVGLLLGTEITANFGADGQVGGNAGCNQYFASYSANGNAITIGLAGTTFMFCAEPPGLMEQESEYLAALQSAATYRIEGDQLEMRTAADQIAVMMTRGMAVDLPEPTPLPTTPWARVTAPQGTSIHTGPGVDYPLIGFARTGDEGVIAGRDADWRWWAVSLPSAPDGIGWVSADDVIAMNVGDVPVLAAPPPSVPTAAPPVAAPTQVASATPVPPTATPVPPTATRVPPTATPVPPTATPAAQISFSADQTNIQQGQCTTLRWSVENVQGVWVYPQGERYYRFPRTGQGSEAVCPPRTTTYEMRVLLRDGSTTFRQVTVNVAGPPPTAVPTAVPNPLAGTRWDVVNYNNGGGSLVGLLEGTLIAIEFAADGQLLGNAGCNNYFTFYQLGANNSITIGPPGATSLFCVEPAGVMDQETQFLAALQTAATFRISGGTLELRSASEGAVVATRAP